MSAPRLCINCKHFVAAYGTCRAPENNKAVKPSLINGFTQYEPRWYCASTHREDCLIASVLNRTCGKRGRWFESK